MNNNPLDKIYEMIRMAKIVPHKKRQEFFCDMLGGVIKNRSVVFSEIADKIDKPISTSSIEQRIHAERIMVNGFGRGEWLNQAERTTSTTWSWMGWWLT